jgi:predicted PurR-regulated permease PerM
LPIVGQQLYDFWALASTNARSALAPILPQLRPLGEKLIEAVSSAGVGTLKFLVSVLVMGFLFLYARSLVAIAENLAGKIDKAHGARFVDLAGATIRAVSRGVIGISLLQAVAVGIGMSLASVPGASVLTLLVLILGIVQIGPGLVTVPVAIWAWTQMPPASALGLTICLVAVSLADALVKPFFSLPRSHDPDHGHLHWGHRRHFGAWHYRPVCGADRRRRSLERRGCVAS